MFLFELSKEPNFDPIRQQNCGIKQCSLVLPSTLASVPVSVKLSGVMNLHCRAAMERQTESGLVGAVGGRRGWDELREWHCHIYTTMSKTGN